MTADSTGTTRRSPLRSCLDAWRESTSSPWRQVLALLLALGWGVAAAGDIDLVQTPEQPYSAAEALLLEDPDHRLDLAAVLKLPDHAWIRSTDEILRPGFSRSAWWVHLDLRNPSSAPRRVVLELAQPTLDLLDIAVTHDDRVLLSRATGDARPFASRPLPHRYFALPIDLPAGMSLDMYLRLDSRDGIYDPMPLRLRDAEAFAQASEVSDLLLGAYFGAILCFSVYHVLLSFSTRERLFLTYGVYLGLFALENLGLEGYGFRYLWTGHPWLNQQLDVLLPSLIHVTATLLTIDYLDTRRRVPWIHRALVGLTALLALPASITLTDAFGLAAPLAMGSYLFQAISAVLLLLYLIAGIAVLGRGYRPAAYYVAGWGWSSLGVTVYYLQRAFGLLPASWLTENSLAIGSLLEFLFLALALGDRFNRMKDETLLAERRLLEYQSAQSGQLEALVRERTVELRQAMQRIEVLARTDELTQLLNLRAFNDAFPREFARAGRDHDLLAFGLLDIDNFKRYNDHYGHAAGDEALRQVGAVINRWLRRPGDYAFRLGGEEFGLLIGRTESRDHALGLTERIRQEVQNLAIPHGANDAGVVTCSIGLAFNQDLTSPAHETLYRRADQALYQAKSAGRNRVVIARGEPGSPAEATATEGAAPAPGQCPPGSA